MRQEFSIQLQNEVQVIAKHVDVVRNGNETELTKCVQNFKSECNKINENINDYKSQTDTSMNSLRSAVNQKREEVENKIGELTHEVRSVASGLDECNSNIQKDKRNYPLEIQRPDSQIEDLRASVNGNLAIQTGSAVCASQQTSSTIRMIRIGGPTSQASPAV
jgi:chromosome segregation ATPase